MTRALSIYLPHWPSQVARRKQAQTPRPPATTQRAGGAARPPRARPDDAALLLIARQAGVETVADGCPRAQRGGVRPGMSLAQARALLGARPTLCLPYAPDDDLRWLRRLAAWTLRYTPVVAVDPPDGLLLDITGCQHLFGGEARLLHSVSAGLTSLGLQACLATAPTYGAAWALARYRPQLRSSRGSKQITPLCTLSDAELGDVLATLPVEALRIDADLVAALHEVGFERIEHLRAVPRGELAARFGPRLLQRLDQATGTLPEKLEAFQPARRWEVRREFDGPVTRPEVVATVVGELLAELLNELAAEARGIRHLEIALRRVHQPAAVVRVALTRPSRAATHIAGLIEPKLERVHLGWGVEEICLRAVRTSRCRSAQERLWAATGESDGGHEWHAREHAALGEWLDRLREQVGAAAIRRAQPRETHAPEEVFPLHVVSDTDVLVARAGSRQLAGLCRADRPSYLLAPPEPARVISLVPEGPPIWLTWERLAGRVLTACGPERIALPWWTGAETVQTRTRDYYQVQDEHGRWLWLFRCAEPHGWFVHGVWV